MPATETHHDAGARHSRVIISWSTSRIEAAEPRRQPAIRPRLQYAALNQQGEHNDGKRYWISVTSINEGYKPYAAANPAIFKVRRPICRSRRPVSRRRPEPGAETSRLIRDYETALVTFPSEYQANINVRQPFDCRPHHHRGL
jgi:hypothetical protein